MVVPVGDDIDFGDVIVPMGFSLKPLPGVLRDWGFTITFSCQLGRREEDVRIDHALVLLLKRKERRADDPRRDVCLISNDIDAARLVIAAGGFVPDGDAGKAIRMIVVGDKNQAAPVK